MGRMVRTRSLVTGVVAAGVLATGAMAEVKIGAATIGTDPCGTTVSFVQPFLSWGDYSTYVAIPGGSFESATPTFTLAGGAAVTGGNEPFSAGGFGAHSLALPTGSSATSPAMCVGVFYPTLRGFAVNTGDPASTLRVDALYRTTTGIQKQVTVGSITSTGTWQPTKILAFNVGSLTSTGNGQMVNFKFTVVGAGSWKIDDLYVDPIKHG